MTKQEHADKVRAAYEERLRMLRISYTMFKVNGEPLERLERLEKAINHYEIALNSWNEACNIMELQ